MEHMLLEGLLGRFHQPLAGSGDAASEDDGFRINHGGIVGKSETQVLTRTTEGLYGHGVTLFTQLCYHPWRQLRHTAHLGSLARLCHHLTSRTDNTLRSRIGFQTALVATATQTAVMHHTRMTDLSGITVRPQFDASVGIYTAA